MKAMTFTRRITVVTFLGCALLLFACNKLKDTAKGGKYDGKYSGTMTKNGGGQFGEWELEISGESGQGRFLQSSSIYNFQVSIDNHGNMGFSIQLNGNEVSGWINISADKDFRVGGLWSDKKGEAGYIEGTRTSSSGSGSGSCSSHELLGKWYTTSGNIDILFLANCAGELHYKDVNNTPGCESGSITRFKWSTQNGMLSLDYTGMTICGVPRNTPKNDPPQKYSISGGTLNWAGASWRKK